MSEPAGPAGLREDASVSLALHDGKTALECRVVGFHRTFVVLRHAASLHQRALRRSAFGYVMFDLPDTVAALRVEIMGFSDEDVTVRIVDRFDFSRQRRYSRLHASWPIILEPLDDGCFGDPVPTTTIDISAGGALVQCEQTFPDKQAFRITLRLPDADLEVPCAAEALQSDGETVALRFIGLSPELEATLGHAILNALAVLAAPTRTLEVEPLETTPDREWRPERRQETVDKMVAMAASERAPL